MLLSLMARMKGTGVPMAASVIIGMMLTQLRDAYRRWRLRRFFKQRPYALVRFGCSVEELMMFEKAFGKAWWKEAGEHDGAPEAD